MRRIGIRSLLAVWLALVGAQPSLLRGQANAEGTGGPEFKEVYDLVRSHLAGMSEAQLNQAAVRALVTSLGPRVSLITNGAAARSQGENPILSKSNVFDGVVGYLRVEQVGDGLADAIRQACKKLTATNKLDGLVLDLRYATGDDYGSAVATADLFIKKEQPLLDWGTGMVRSKDNGDEISLPVAVLVNRQTAGAAEALAAVLREAGSGLVLGNRTAGQAMIAQDYPLKNGDRLRIATAPIQLGDGSTLSDQGLKPDITIEVPPAEERAFYADAYRVPSRAALMAGSSRVVTNQPSATSSTVRRPRFNEAELVRERREGISEADMTALGNREPEKPVVTDPVLARALDLLKGLALVRQSHS